MSLKTDLLLTVISSTLTISTANAASDIVTNFPDSAVSYQEAVDAVSMEKAVRVVASKDKTSRSIDYDLKKLGSPRYSNK